jgi:hypothetical protein
MSLDRRPRLSAPVSSSPQQHPRGNWYARALLYGLLGTIVLLGPNGLLSSWPVQAAS